MQIQMTLRAIAVTAPRILSVSSGHRQVEFENGTLHESSQSTGREHRILRMRPQDAASSAQRATVPEHAQRYLILPDVESSTVSADLLPSYLLLLESAAFESAPSALLPSDLSAAAAVSPSEAGSFSFSLPMMLISSARGSA